MKRKGVFKGSAGEGRMDFLQRGSRSDQEELESDLDELSLVIELRVNCIYTYCITHNLLSLIY